jgi:hypothetical protein
MTCRHRGRRCAPAMPACWCGARPATINADLQAIIEAGRGDVPLKDLKFRCAQSAAG